MFEDNNLPHVLPYTLDMLQQILVSAQAPTASTAGSPVVDLVTVSACYSAQTADIFHKVGVRNVVAVHNSDKVMDRAAQVCVF